MNLTPAQRRSVVEGAKRVLAAIERGKRAAVIGEFFERPAEREPAQVGLFEERKLEDVGNVVE